MPDREDREPDDVAFLEQNISRLLQRAHEPPRMDDGSRTRILAALRTRPRRVRWLRPAIAAAVALAACVLLVLAIGDREPSPADTEALVHANDDARTHTVELDDGTTVILRADAAFEELGPRRIRLVRGEAILEVASAEEPFVVETEQGRALALGTRFAVRSDLGEVVTSVLRGTVRIEAGDANETLLAGESGAMRDGAVSRRTARRLSHEVAWARDALTEAPDAPRAARKGNLVARDPRWAGEWPLPIRRMKVDVYVENGIARTTIDQTFFNHVHRQLEGVYSFPLPPDAAVSRLAMYVDGELMEGGIIERDRGRDVYESIVYQRRDPALLEWMSGNAFRIRVFPLPARTEKRIVLSYTQALPELYGDYDVRVPIPEVDLPVGELEIAVNVAEGRRWELTSSSHVLATKLREGFLVGQLTSKDATIGDDLALRLRRADGSAPEAELATDGEHVMARVRPRLPDAPRHEQRRWVVLYDTSASRSDADLRAQSFFLQRFLGAVDEDDRLGVIAFDSTQRAFADALQAVDEIDPAAIDRFVQHEGREHVGETDLHAALTRALELVASSDEGAPHILLLGDGLATAAGKQSGSELQALLRGHAAFVGVAIGDTTDAALVRGLADATGGLAVELDRGEDLAWRAIELVSTLDTARLQAVEVELLDAAGKAIVGEHVLTSAGSLADGEALVVLAKSPGVAPTAARVKGTIHGDAWSHTFALPTADSEARYVPRLWARARIAALQADGVEAHAEEITQLGLEHFLVTPTTSLIVLENEAMYRSFAVTRPKEDAWGRYDAPAKIPVVYEPAGVEIPPGSHVVRTPVEVVGWSEPYQKQWFGGTEEGTIGLGSLGLIGTGGGGGGRGHGGIGLRTTTSSIGAKRSAKVDVDQRSLDIPTTPTPDAATSTPVTVFIPSAVPQSSLAFKSGKVERRESARSRGSRGDRARIADPTRRPWPRGLAYASDPGLDDLTEQLPAIFEDAFDLEREQLLLASATGRRGSITDEARELVEASRAAAPIGRLQLDDGTRLSLARDGRFRAVHSDGYLAEEIVYDGTDAIAFYPELELAIRRRVEHAAPLLLAQSTPWLLPSPEQLAFWYDVTRIGPRQLALRVTDDATETVYETIIELDASDRIAVVTRKQGDVETQRIELRYPTRSIELVENRRTTEIRVLDPDPGALEPAFDRDRWPVVELPLRPAAERQQQVDGLEAGASLWRHAVHQLMASLVAERRPSELPLALGLLLADPATPQRGELALASAGAQWIGDAVWSDIGKRMGTTDPVVEYLVARRGLSDVRMQRRFAQLAKTHHGTVIGMLSAYRSVLANPTPAAAQAFVDGYDHPAFAFVVTQRAASEQWNRPERAVAIWEALAKRWPQWRVFASYTAGQTLYSVGRYDDAAARFEQMFAAADAVAEPPIVDWTVHHSFTASRGGAGRWRAQWARWREQVRASKDGAEVVTFVLAALQLGDRADARRMLRELEPGVLDGATAGFLVDSLMASGEVVDAQRVLTPMLEVLGDDPELQLRASHLAERQGRLRDAADHLERILELTAEDGLELTRLRELYTRLFDLESRVVHAAGENELDRALAVATRWRIEDPDNDQIDVLAAELLFTSDRPDQAWRQLSSITERHPALGDAHAKVAEVLEREALFERADAAWERAFAVEPTNPTWLLRRATNRMGYGDPDDARPFLDRIADGQWQPRFSGVVAEAASLRTR